MASRVLYFAYGSNLLPTRLQRRCPGARIKTLACARGYRVAFDKLSEDTSGKANLVRSGSTAAAFGVVYEIPSAEVDALDTVEGSGYARQEGFAVSCMASGKRLRTMTYMAQQNVPGLLPFDWYLALVLGGLRVHAADADYALAFESAEFVTDPELSRPTRLNALRDLAAAGFTDYADLLRADT